VPLNPAFNAPQIVHALSHLDVAHLIIGAEANASHKPPRPNLPLLETLIPNLKQSKLESEVVPSLRSVVLVDNSYGRIDMSEYKSIISYGDIMHDGTSGIDLEKVELHPDEVVNIQFTSGTTSLPKAARLSHRSILNNGKSIGDRMLLTGNDIVCCPPPLFQ